jgi:hypothetical protein
MRYRSLLPGALALSTFWLAGCGDNSTEPTQPAEPTPSGAELAVAGDRWITRANLPTARAGFALATVTNAAGQSIVYAIGGRTDVYPMTVLRKVTAYNVATNTWTERRPLPAPLSHSNGAGVINGKIYVSGGFTVIGDGPPTRALYVYDPGTNTWVRKRDLPAIYGGPTKDWTVGWGGVTGVIDGKLYVVTFCHSYMFYSENPFCENDVIGPRLFRYNPATDRWVTLAPPFPVAYPYSPDRVSTLAGGVIGGKFYVMGGDYTLKGRLSVYDPATNRWTTLTRNLPQLAGASAVVLQGKLYVMGGSGHRETRVYDPVANTWHFRAFLPSVRDYASASKVFVNGQPRIELVGGRGPGGLAADNNLQYIP